MLLVLRLVRNKKYIYMGAISARDGQQDELIDI